MEKRYVLVEIDADPSEVTLTDAAKLVRVGLGPGGVGIDWGGLRVHTADVTDAIEFDSKGRLGALNTTTMWNAIEGLQ